jgi:heme-degrading monooxygenase HmoA
MIARVWRARTSGPEKTEQYHQVFEADVLEHLRGLAGFRGAYLLARHDIEWTEIRAMTLFESLEAIKRFAGDDYERERVTPAARAVLLDSDPVIRLYDVLAAPGRPPHDTLVL